MSLSTIWQELEHIFGIATAAAPIIALADPAAATGIGSAEAALTLVTPAVNAVLANAAADATPEQVQSHVTSLVNFAVNTAIAKGTVSADKVAAIQAAVPALIATAAAVSAAANKPLA